MTHSSWKIPEVLSGALGTSVFVCMAQRLGAYFLEKGEHVDFSSIVFWSGAALAATIFVWTIKDLVDDFRAYDHDPGVNFNAATTIFFSVSRYTIMATSAASVFTYPFPHNGLICYFVSNFLWSATSFARRWSVTEDDKEEFAKRRQRQRGMLNHAICGLALMAAWYWRSDCHTILACGVTALVLARDFKSLFARPDAETAAVDAPAA